METNKILTRKFVEKNTNNLYYESSRKTITKIIFLLSCVLVAVVATVVYKYSNKKLSNGSLTVSLLITSLAYVGLLIASSFIMNTNHLFPKKVTNFMVRLKEYNDGVIKILQDVLQDGEHLVFNEGSIEVKDQISALRDEYDWLEDPVNIMGKDDRYEAHSLMFGYVNQLSTIKKLAGDLRIEVKTLRAVSIENLKRAGLYFNKAEDFENVSKILTAARLAGEYYSNLHKHLAQRLLLGEEIEKYFTSPIGVIITD